MRALFIATRLAQGGRRGVEVQIANIRIVYILATLAELTSKLR